MLTVGFRKELLIHDESCHNFREEIYPTNWVYLPDRELMASPKQAALRREPLHPGLQSAQQLPAADPVGAVARRGPLPLPDFRPPALPPLVAPRHRAPRRPPPGKKADFTDPDRRVLAVRTHELTQPHKSFVAFLSPLPKIGGAIQMHCEIWHYRTSLD